MMSEKLNFKHGPHPVWATAKAQADNKIISFICYRLAEPKHAPDTGQKKRVASRASRFVNGR